MKLKVSRAEMWTATIEDRTGGAADLLAPLAKAGANLETLLARRTPEQPGKGVLFLSPIKGAKVVRAAQEAGLAKSENVHGVRIEGGDKPGMSAKITRALADAGISFRALSAMAIGRKFVAYLALDTAEEAVKAVGVLRKLS
jgi:predicted amino acid-binding ACT domain protein